MALTATLTATQASALSALARERARLTAAQAAQVDAVLRCRGAGLSWEIIASELGISHEAAWEQFAQYSRYDPDEAA